MPVPIWYSEVFNQYHKTLNAYDHLYIGLSAGIDSNMLLNWLHTYRDQLPPITAIHVNHQWHGEDSVIWANFAKQSAERYGFEFVHYDVVIDIDAKGAEACGREARYIKFAETMVGNGLLVVAHHRSDQAETVMYRLLRGSGTLGLGGMRDLTQLKFGEHTLSVCRPFLSISKTALYQAGEMMNIPWMEDYTNHETEEARNQIRNAIFPAVAQYFPHYEQTFARSAQLIQESDELLLEIAKADYKTTGRALSEGILELALLRNLSLLRFKNVVRYWLKQLDIILEKRQFDEFLSMFVEKKPTSQSCFSMENWCIRAFKDRLYWLPIESQKSTQYRYELIEAQNAPPLSFWQQQNLVLENRRDGVSFHPMWRNKSQTLKKILQEIELEPWLRPKVQMLSDQNSEQIFWVQYLGMNHSYQNICEPTGYLPVIIEEN